MNKTDMIGLKIGGANLIRAGQEDYYNGLSNCLEETMWLIIRVTGDMKYYLEEETLEKIRDEELDMGGVATPSVLEYYLMNKAKKDGRKVVDKRNKKQVQQIESICDVAYNLFEYGVEHPDVDV